MHPAVLRFAALGDSVTLGIGDRGADRRWRGWSALLATALTEPGPVDFRNLADSGALLRDVHARQLPQALHWRPHLASVLVGINDTLRGAFDLTAMTVQFHETVASLTAQGTRVLTVCLPDPGRMLGVPGLLARPLARRVLALNEIIHTVGGRHRALHVHLCDSEVLNDRRMWSVDRLHPSERGHRWLARQSFEALREGGCPVNEPPSEEPDSVEPSRMSQAWWMATQGVQWMLRRSTDLLPHLLHLATQEWRLAQAGRSDLLDLRVTQDLEMALAALEA
ncbi:SGNH hydrolase [Rhizocola hellebori]|uniref:SGNH hydrolase n=1 Tax=Rhizocola hellebori TaxID=1392758 RepID=A0A8J3Q6A2_9ACTN|nr:SGNH/GDSL hydrolase family protein [Rhizocola hellebori]GIH04833.1 SGNH hydrolase [Rhizocola hellebori]